MPTLRANDEEGQRDFARKSGATLAQVRIAVETVGYDQDAVISFLKRKKWLKSPVAASLAQGVQVAAEEKVHPVPPSPSTAIAEAIPSYARSPEKFQQFLDIKASSNETVRSVLKSARLNQCDETEVMRMLIIELVEWTEVLERQVEAMSRKRSKL